ncbi:hypothetical protein M595_0215 [Lyngbya aestuarii BL J]|uniref:Uncharacterized protein n=1 Tax=Lyngbya aestuarii BL J TaxID=1348334 RepID=U7QTV8_9CYAN|nr:hypothetical protein [Lyngbya aestuarii]ERT09866.1 hypothetical protein M595_0215 [Lyngbya aestuarii BL J]
MGTASKYWKLVKLTSSGQRKISEIPSAQAFFQSALTEGATRTEVSDVAIQQKLTQWYREPKTLPDSHLSSTDAQLCLLCFISWEIEQTCLYLEAKFGTEHGFSRQDLFPLVLDESGEINPKNSSYQSLARQILESFDPQKSSLATWTNRRVKYHPELNTFLLERGIYMVSNWAILNDTRPKQLERILSEVYQLTPLEVQRSSQILSSYHNVYRRQRLQQRSSGFKRRCQPPTPEQYEQMANVLNAQYYLSIPTKMIAQNLQEIATQLRDYRIYSRGGQFPTQSLDSSNSEGLEQLTATEPTEDNDNTQAEFLEQYRQQFMSCLDLSLLEVVEQRLSKLKRRNPEKSEQFLKALSLFHCREESMGEIAKKLGLKAQYQVTRLLNLKEFRADVRQKLLIQLRDRILDFAKSYTDVQRLQTLDHQLDEALNEEIDKLMKEAESESHNSQESSTKSLFSQRLCEQIDCQFNC